MLAVSSFFFNDTSTTEIYTLSLHDALPISGHESRVADLRNRAACRDRRLAARRSPAADNRVPRSGPAAAWIARTRIRSEEHTSELQSHVNLVCRLLLEKKKYLELRKKFRAV